MSVKAGGKDRLFQINNIKKWIILQQFIAIWFRVLVPWLKLSQRLDPLNPPEVFFFLSNLSTDSKSEAFFFLGLSSLDLTWALPSWDFVSCNLVSMAFRLSRIGADILLAGQLQVPVQQIYTESTHITLPIRCYSPPKNRSTYTHKS